MIKMTVSFSSISLLRPVQIYIGLPNNIKAHPPYRVVWALHCAIKDGALFFDELGAGELVDSQKTAIIAPSLGNGYYVNSPFDAQADFLNEILHALPDILPISRKKEDNAVLGISMGGFGAMRWALQNRRFVDATAISGVFDCHIQPDERILKNRTQRILHTTLEQNMRRLLLDDSGQTVPDADLGALMAKSGEPLPSIRLYCGSGDYISLPQSAAFLDLCKANNLPVTLKESDGGHDVDYWRQAFADAFTDMFA